MKRHFPNVHFFYQWKKCPFAISFCLINPLRCFFTGNQNVYDSYFHFSGYCKSAPIFLRVQWRVVCKIRFSTSFSAWCLAHTPFSSLTQADKLSVSCIRGKKLALLLSVHIVCFYDDVCFPLRLFIETHSSYTHCCMLCVFSKRAFGVSFPPTFFACAVCLYARKQSFFQFCLVEKVEGTMCPS